VGLAEITGSPLQLLIDKCISGDSEAQRQLFNKYKKLFFGLAYKSLGPEYDIQEVVHEIFIQVFKGLPGFKARSSFDTWVYRVGTNVCMATLRKKYQKRQLTIIHEDEVGKSKLLRTPETPVDTIEHNELEEKIYEALNKLDDKKRMVVVLCDMEEKTLEEVAEIIQRPIGTVKSRLFHGRNEMKEYLSPYLNS